MYFDESVFTAYIKSRILAKGSTVFRMEFFGGCQKYRTKKGTTFYQNATFYVRREKTFIKRMESPWKARPRKLLV